MSTVELDSLVHFASSLTRRRNCDKDEVAARKLRLGRRRRRSPYSVTIIALNLVNLDHNSSIFEKLRREEMEEVKIVEYFTISVKIPKMS